MKKEKEESEETNAAARKEELLSNENKPKVTFEHRYRVNRMLNKPIESEDTQNESLNEEEESSNNENKPKIGFEHRYRYSKYLESLQNAHEKPEAESKTEKNVAFKKSENNKKTSSSKKAKKSEQQKEVDEDLAKYAPELKQKVGFAYRYRVSLMNKAIEDGTYVKPEEVSKKSSHKQVIKDADDADSEDLIKYSAQLKPKVKK